ncbi:molybdopterin oxidoreductase family protein [Schlesneria paludicola]|uniref:molybdopterin oxidoreductase family protein n=1 Tax=Schlesneria paludicola TaxID=360056 RepID=UPI00029A8C0E|nr:nitrate reductase [Schlesneria paludicola]
MNWLDLRNLIRAHDGPMTRELLQRPGDFGLARLPESITPTATTNLVCGFCSTGCSLTAHLQADGPVGLSPTTEYPVNLGMACPKGWEALTVLNSPDRATTPLLKNSRGKFEQINWPTATRTFAERWMRIRDRYGPEAMAWLGTGQIATEEMAFLGALGKFGMGMLHGDGNTRQCMATAVVAYKQSFGFDAPPYTYADFEESDVIVLVGANLCIAHPILWERVMRNRRQPQIVVIDPRRTETAMAATMHLAIKPKSDLPLFYGIAHILFERGWIDADYLKQHTSGAEEFRKHVASYTPEFVANVTGILPERLEEFAQLVHTRKRVSFWWTMGINQSYEGVRAAQSLINLALMTGNIGRPGTGANSITGQCNAMGSRLFSNTTGLFAGREFTDPAHRNEVSQILEIPLERIPDKNSFSYHEILKGILDGKIKGLWVIATNPAHSWINQDQAKDILSRLEFLVVQDMYTSTETAQLADLMLPAAAWGEKSGTLINSERRIGTIKQIARAPGQALSDFRIFQLIAQACGVGSMFRQWSSPAAVFQLLKQLSKDRPCDFSGIEDESHLDRSGGIQWPFPPLQADSALTDSAERSQITMPVAGITQERRLFADGKFFHADGRAKLRFEASRPMPEPPNDDFPLILLTGRGTAVQWHTQTRTAKSAVLQKLSPRNIYVEINPADARRLGVQPQQTVLVESRRASIRATAFLTQSVPPGQIFLPMHYAEVNRLTDAVFDPYSKQPSYKACAVRLRLPS